jgi:hypothetical protein
LPLFFLILLLRCSFCSFCSTHTPLLASLPAPLLLLFVLLLLVLLLLAALLSSLLPLLVLFLSSSFSSAPRLAAPTPRLAPHLSLFPSSSFCSFCSIHIPRRFSPQRALASARHWSRSCDCRLRSGCHSYKLQLRRGLSIFGDMDDSSRKNNTARVIRISEYDQSLFRSRPL